MKSCVLILFTTERSWALQSPASTEWRKSGELWTFLATHPPITTASQWSPILLRTTRWHNHENNLRSCHSYKYYFSFNKNSVVFFSQPGKICGLILRSQLIVLLKHKVWNWIMILRLDFNPRFFLGNTVTTTAIMVRHSVCLRCL